MSTDPAIMTDAPSPFNGTRADVILQSSDGVNFRVRKAILAEASPVFENMFCLPPPPSMHADRDDAPELAAVPMAENSTVMEGLLRLCYPVDARSSRGPALDEVVFLLGTARKYDMRGIEAHIIQVLRDSVETSPLRVYCLAVLHNLDKDLIRTAAKAFLDVPASDSFVRRDVPELDHISGTVYGRILDYRHACAVAASGVVDNYPVEEPQFKQRCWAICTDERENRCQDLRSHIVPSGEKFKVVKWFDDFMLRCKDHVGSRPSGKEIASQQSIIQALSVAWRCHHCAKRAWDQVHEFLPVLVDKIECVVSQITLEIH